MINLLGQSEILRMFETVPWFELSPCVINNDKPKISLLHKFLVGTDSLGNSRKGKHLAKSPNAFPHLKQVGAIFPYFSRQHHFKYS